MPHTLVTGANSFVSAHVIQALINAGHSVTGTVRRASAGEAILSVHPEWKGHFDFVEIEDYAKEGVFHDVFKAKEYDHIVHVAAPMGVTDPNADYEKDFLLPGVNNNLSLLHSAKKFAPTLKSVAITGSINAITMGDDLENRILTNESWNNITIASAKEVNNPFVSYCSSKKEAELAVWDFVTSEKPSFTITVLLPALIFGPPIQPLKAPATKNLNFSVGVIYSLFDGSNKERTPGTMFPSYIDVRDLADAHVKTLTAEGAKNKRFLIGGRPLALDAAVEALRGVKDLEGRLPRENAEMKVVVPKIEAGEGNEVLGMEFRSFESTIRDTAEKILELEKEG
ncbi:NAD(P)-binding protein [Tothia fuscella]|uniref:NAD(P)-binding protein n=1 Tax=Tothia fuscella TaxID=1048955 RepID=A0A9P4U218_9PEZI|nr:NAD(P)-binding protein [Tothia fuscella]